jgi:hypothetical protein
MEDYLKSVLLDVPSDMDWEYATPVSNHLFTMNEENPVKLDTTKGEQFHHIVAQSLFLCKRARPDIQPSVSFLCTRVKSQMRTTTRNYPK